MKFPALFILLSLPLHAATVIIDTFSGSYHDTTIPYPGGTLRIQITGDSNDTFLSVRTGDATATSFQQSAIMLADTDAATTDLQLTFSAPVTNLFLRFTDIDADATPTFSAPTPNDLLVAHEFSGQGSVTTSGANAPTAPAGSLNAPIIVVGQIIRASNAGTSAIATFSFPSPQTVVRLNYQNGGSGGIGLTEIRFDPVPEPSALLLAALSLPMLLRRKRSR